MNFLKRNWWSVLNFVIMAAIVWGDWHTKDRSVVNSNFFLVGIAIVLIGLSLWRTSEEWQRPIWYREFQVTDMKDMGVSGIFSLVLCVDVFLLSMDQVFRLLALLSFVVLAVLVHRQIGRASCRERVS